MIETIGQLIGGVGFFGAGMAAGITALILGASRGMSQKSDMWALILSVFTWIVALTIPNAIWASVLFAIGAVALTMAYTPIINKLPENNVFTMAIIAILVNVMIIVGSGVYTFEGTWDDTLDESQENIYNVINEVYSTLSGQEISSGLCAPGDASCETSALTGAFTAVNYDVLASIFAIGTYVGKSIKFAGMVLLAPVAIRNIILPTISNAFIYLLIAFYMTTWNFVILYKTIIFIIKRQSNL